jgi:hypothetical protein
MTPIHRYERLHQNYARQLAADLKVHEVQLPQPIGIALNDENRLSHFARLYGAGQVISWEVDNLWHLYNGTSWHTLTFIPEQTLVDAAAYFVTQQNINVNTDALKVSENLPPNQEANFVALLKWLLDKKTVI